MKKFIILSSQRSGSNYLCSLLQDHPQIFAGGEIFTKYNRFMKNYLSLNDIQFDDVDPVEYIKDFFARFLKKKVSYIGFRLFYDHQKNKRDLLWNTLKSIPDFSFIHLQRRNLLKKFLSLKLATKTSTWKRTETEPEKSYDPIFINFRECSKYFLNMEKEIHDTASFFKDSQIMDVFYENLAADKNSEINKILDFLGLKPEILKSKLKKQNTQDLTKIIINYSKLKKKFKDTNWEIFFDD